MTDDRTVATQVPQIRPLAHTVHSKYRFTYLLTYLMQTADILTYLMQTADLIK